MTLLKQIGAHGNSFTGNKLEEGESVEGVIVLSITIAVGYFFGWKIAVCTSSFGFSGLIM